MKPALVLLAAGASRRLGTCKALCDLDGRTPLERLLAAGSVLDDGPALVITGAHQREISGAGAHAELAHNEHWEQGRTGGVLLARERRPGRDLCLAPVDAPLVPRSVFAALAAAWEAAGAPANGWLAPRFEGRHGHPVLVGRGLLGTLDPDAPGRPLSHLRQAADPLLAVEVPHAEILDDLDTPEDLERLLARIRT